MSGMLDLTNVLQLIVDRLDQKPLAKKNLVPLEHQRVFHVLARLCHQMYAVNEELLEQALTDVSFVCEDLAEYLFVKSLVFQRLPVVNIGRSQHEFKNLAPVVYDQMELKPEDPAHRRAPFGGYRSECSVPVLTLGVAHADGRRVDERDTRTLARATHFQKTAHLDHIALLEFHETIVADSLRELALAVRLNVVDVEVLQITELPQMKHDHDGYNFAVRHFEGAIAVFFAIIGHDKIVLLNFIEFFAEFVHQTENFK